MSETNNETQTRSSLLQMQSTNPQGTKWRPTFEMTLNKQANIAFLLDTKTGDSGHSRTIDRQSEKGSAPVSWGVRRRHCVTSQVFNKGILKRKFPPIQRESKLAPDAVITEDPGSQHHFGGNPRMGKERQSRYFLLTLQPFVKPPSWRKVCMCLLVGWSDALDS